MVKKILAGLFDACHTSFQMKNGDFTKISPEYLLTVLVARQIAENNDNYILKLEESTCNFASSCVPQINANWETSKKHNVQRNGKIDIAVYKGKSNNNVLPYTEALCPIELKGINPYLPLVLEDINRNIDFFLIKDEKTGNSIIETSYFACIEMAKEHFYLEEIEDFKAKTKKKYLNLFDDNFIKKINHHNLKLEITVEKIMEDLNPKNQKFDTSEGGFEYDDMSNFHCYLGVVIELKKK
jgi:hypothetical protein